MTVPPNVAEERLLSKRSLPKSTPEPAPVPATESLEGISTISHTSSKGGSSSNAFPSGSFIAASLSSAPPDPGVKSRQNDPVQDSGSHFWLHSHPRTHHHYCRYSS